MKHQALSISLLAALLIAVPSCVGESETDKTPKKSTKKKYTFKDKKKAKQQFQTFCASCHGTSGKGDGPAGMALNPKPRDWTDPAWQDGISDEHIFNVLRDGGAKHGLSPLMPPNPGRSSGNREMTPHTATSSSLRNRPKPVSCQRPR